MSKYVKDLMTSDLRRRWEGVTNLLLVDVIGMEANQNVVLRKRLREKEIHLSVIKNSLAKRATEGTPLAPAFESATGTTAVVWGGEDIVSLAKEVCRLADDTEFAPFAPKGGVMDGNALDADMVTDVSKWPTRGEQLSILAGQILSPGATLSAQLLGPGGKLASQIESKSESDSEA